MSEPHPKCSSPHRPAEGEVWEAQGQQGKLQLEIAHMTGWAVEGPKVSTCSLERHRVIAGRSCLLRRIRRAS